MAILDKMVEQFYKAKTVLRNKSYSLITLVFPSTSKSVDIKPFSNNNNIYTDTNCRTSYRGLIEQFLHPFKDKTLFPFPPIIKQFVQKTIARRRGENPTNLSTQKG